MKKNTKRILVVEDNAIAQKVAQTIFLGLSYRVDVASKGMDALILCEKNHYDLIFLDVGLGEGIDGYDVANHIRDSDDPNNQTPIIALTAHGGDENKQRCIEAGMDAVLSKPLTQQLAADMIQAFIKGKKEIKAKEADKVQRDLPDTDVELFQLNQYSLFDSKVALENYREVPVLTEILKAMLEDLEPELERMETAFNEKDYETVERLSHKIKSGALYVFAYRMKYACQYLERYFKAGKRDLFEKLYHQAVTVIHETRGVIEEWLNEHEVND